MQGAGEYRFAPRDCPVCGGDGLGWACDGCGQDGGPCARCQELGAPGGCFGCARDTLFPLYLAMEEQMIVAEMPAPPPPRPRHIYGVIVRPQLSP